MAYLLQSDLEGRVPADVVIEALDDDRDGSADPGVFEKIVSDVEQAINGRLEGRFSVPLDEPLPYSIREGAVILGCEALYLRRGRAGEANPFYRQAEAFRARLEKIGRGDEPLKYNEAPAATGGTAITEESRTYQASGEMMV
jgi:phage gp36-like protein